MRPMSRSRSVIAALLPFLVASVLTVPVRADDSADKPHVEMGVLKKPALPKRAGRADKETKTVDATSAKPAVNRLIEPPTASPKRDLDLAGPAAGDHDAFTLSPKWSASNGGNSAPYGTRALLNELQANPSEITGYGAGAEVNFHF